MSTTKGIKLSQNRFAALSKDPDSDIPSKKNRKKPQPESKAHIQTNYNKKGNQSHKPATTNQPSKQQQKNKKKETSKVGFDLRY